MGTKETVAKGLKKAARILPGVGSYQDKESARESDKALRMALGRRLDDALGRSSGSRRTRQKRVRCSASKIWTISPDTWKRSPGSWSMHPGDMPRFSPNGRWTKTRWGNSWKGIGP